jgi:acetoin utilization deacetylase AcuC-like enzyme
VNYALSPVKYVKGRLVSVLEGGYDLKALAASAKVFVNELIEAPDE